MSTGYSGTPLTKKLGIKPGACLLLVNGPKNYPRLVAPLPEEVKLASRPTSAVDIVHVFATQKADLAKHLKTFRTTLRVDAAVWVSWPKKTAKMATAITEDTVRDVALPLGFVDIKVCAVDETWSGLKLVVRKELRPKPD